MVLIKIISSYPLLANGRRVSVSG